MHGLEIERYSLLESLSSYLARQLYVRGRQGKTAVVADNPVVLLSRTWKQWMKLVERIQGEYSGILDTEKTAKLTQQIVWMRALRLSADPLTDLLDADVTFATADDFVRVPPVCKTVYITYKFDKEKLHMLTSWMPKGSTVVIYG